jgi:hypothetical protein
MSHTPGIDGHADVPRVRDCRECARLRSALRRDRDRATATDGTSAREAERTRQASKRASVDILSLARSRTVVRIGRHTFGGVERADGTVLIARVPRSESYRGRDVARDRTWRADSEATDVRPCRHKRGHTAKHSHGAPEIDRRTRRTLDALACTVFGHDPRIAALDRSTMGECFAALAAPGYVMVESFTVRAERMIRERREHVEGTWGYAPDEHGRTVRVRLTDACADCRNGERNTSWTATVRDVRAPMPPTRATRDANARLARDWQTVPFDGRADATRARIAATRHADDWARLAALAALDARIGARERA